MTYLSAVEDCGDCPFNPEGYNCRHPAMAKNSMLGEAAFSSEPPTWCPLRIGGTTVVLKPKQAVTQ